MQVAEHETLDWLTPDWRLFQLKKGHRFSTDDLLTAWTAACARPAARRVLDLGAGIGSVGLLTLWRMSEATRLVMVEVQEISHRLAQSTVDVNGLRERVELRLGDLRDPDVVPATQDFDLVTGSPPYIPIGSGAISPHPQRAGARIELNGDIFDYCRAAARAMGAEGAFCFCHAAHDARPEAAIAESGLVLVRRQDVWFRAGRDPTIALFTCRRDGTRQDGPPIVIRDEDGQRVGGYLAIRKEMGMPV